MAAENTTAGTIPQTTALTKKPRTGKATPLTAHLQGSE
jgi:hypothetical protein